MRILFTGGGSGGHIYPIIAVKKEIEKIINLFPFPLLVRFRFIGERPIEKDIFKKENIEMKRIISIKWRRYFSLKNFIDILKFPFSLIQAAIYILIFMPDLIFSKGGPGSFPIVFIGWLYRIPIIIHESDSIPGFTNVLSSPFSKKIIISFKETEEFFPPKKVIWVGNPIRENLLLGDREKAFNIFNLKGGRKIILFIGGSQGAGEINSLLIDAIYKYLERYEIIHIVGQKNFRNIELLIKGILKENQKEYYHLYSYLEEEKLAHAYAISDIIVSRAGAGGIFEIAAIEKPSILIPLKTSAGEHQIRNAQLFVKSGAAIAIEGINITPSFIFMKLYTLLRDERLISQMKKACRNFAKKEAGRNIAKIILENL